jgi:hypothetical protein
MCMQPSFFSMCFWHFGQRFVLASNHLTFSDSSCTKSIERCSYNRKTNTPYSCRSIPSQQHTRPEDGCLHEVRELSAKLIVHENRTVCEIRRTHNNNQCKQQQQSTHAPISASAHWKQKVNPHAHMTGCLRPRRSHFTEFSHPGLGHHFTLGF